MFLKFFFYFSYLLIYPTAGPELIIGEERVSPGIIFIFEGAVKDQIFPSSLHLNQKKTNVHIEARVNWDKADIPLGTPPGGFIPYLYITATLTNEKSGLQTFIDLKPHINLIDNLHYARNISLPGLINDLYSVEFNISPPTEFDVALHKDWLNKFGDKIMSSHKFNYNSINFKEIAQANRE